MEDKTRSGTPGNCSNVWGYELLDQHVHKTHILQCTVHASTSSSSSFSSSAAVEKSSSPRIWIVMADEDEQDVVGEILIIARYSVSKCLNAMWKHSHLGAWLNVSFSSSNKRWRWCCHAMLPWHNSIKIMVYQENYISFERGGACAQDCAKKLISHVCPGRLLYDSNYFISSEALIIVSLFLLHKEFN